ncbi:MAG TPA: nucleotidyltransferase family protein [Gemmatimonadaceae bacterium]|nr:nucleotidyltransferase family protein [Gemmatimonadaceae bacterium]
MSTHERTRSWRLLVACARHAAGLADTREVALAARLIDDWAAAERLACAHGLLPWLARALSDASLSGGAYAPVVAAAGTSAARTLGQMRRLTELLALLERAGVPALPYKGPTLSLQLYGDVALRQSVDLDLVVPFDRYADARAALVAQGLPPRGGHSRRQERTLFAWLGHAPFGRGADFVELHWRFADRRFQFSLTAERALACARVLRVGGQSLPLMHDVDLLAVLAMHGARHLYERLEWLAGVTRLLVAWEGDADRLVTHAESLRARRMLLVSVHMAHRVLGFPLGDDWRRLLASDADATALGATMAADLEGYALRDAPFPGGAALQRRYAELVDTRLDRVKLYIHAALDPTARDHEAVALPDALVPLHRVIRPARLAGTYFARAMTLRRA